MILGLAVCIAAAVLSVWLGGLQHFVGSPMIGLLIGIVLSNGLGEGFAQKVKGGTAAAAKYFLKAGIILAGGTLSFKAVVGVGLSALPLVIFNIILSFLVAWLVGRAMKVPPNTRMLVGGGTAICGGTAIATLTPIVKAKEHEMAYAMTAIFLFDILAAVMWPYAAQAMGLSAQQYGILGGLAISDTSSVTAAGATFDAIMGERAMTMLNGEALSGGDIAVIVKLTRTTMLLFVTIATILVQQFGRRTADTGREGISVARVARAFPLFVLGFLALAALNTFIGFSGISIGGLTLSKLLSKGYKFLITVALVGVGFKIKLRELFTEGARPVLLGGCTWLAVAVSTLLYVLLICG